MLSDSAVTENQYGVYAAGNLTVTGNGTLNINLNISGSGDEITTEYGKALYGLYAKNLTINKDVNVNVNLISNGFSCGMFATSNITVAEKANLDVKCRSKYKNTDFDFPDKVVYGIYSENGDIKLSGTGTKNIEHTYPVNLARPQEAKGVYAQNDRQKGGGRIEISGGKLTIKMPNEGAGINSYYDCVIKNADISIVDAEQGIAVSGATPTATFKGVTITKSKIYISTLGFPSDRAADGIAGIKFYTAALNILDSNVYIESRSCIRGGSDPTSLVFIKGASVVRLINPNRNDPIVLNAYVSTFELSKGGSVTINASAYNFYYVDNIKLGAGTKAEYGTKDSQSTRDSDAYLYRPEYNDGLKIIRFVYGAGAGTATTSDVKVEGMKGYAIDESEFTVTLAGDTFTEIAQNTDVTSWFKNMPSGLVAKIKTKVEAGATSLTIAISGTPQSVETVRAYIEIPEKYLVTGEYDITVDPNQNKVDFSIVSGETIDVPVPSDTQFVYDGEAKVLLKEDGEGYTVSNNKNTFAGEYTAVVTLKKGYKWSDGTTEPKNIHWTIKRQDVTIEVTLAKTTYKYSGYTIEPEYTVYRTTPTGNVELPSSEYKGELSHNKDVGTATLTVKDNGIGNYNITNPVTVNFEIVKDTKTPPMGLKGIAPSADGGSDGKITGTTADMEYSTDTAFTSPKPCTDGETTGLAEGTYYVRYKETGISEASDYVEVKVALNSVTVVGGTGGGKYAAGTSVTVKVTVPIGKTFASWTFRGVVLNTAQITQQEITFTMPENDVVLTALFKDIDYNITVTDGTSSTPTANYQDEVTVTANAPATDMYFDKWEVTGLDTTGMDLSKTEIKFQMPAGDVTFKATYLAITKYEIVVVDGTKDKSPAKAGETITITANPAPAGKVFDKWTCETAGVTIEFESATSSTTTFVMPAREIEIKAHFRAEGTAPSIEIKVEGGTGAGTYKEGDSVTITANDPAEGKVFNGWQDASGKIVSTEKSYTFKVTGATTLTAVYEDAPAAKKGLSGSAIAGIVIGSVAVAGIGGFAVLWFAVKKKTFADLGVALKKVFTAMGNGIKTACRAIGNFFKTLGAKIKALFTKKK